ncbi:MAG: hypothetical protein PHY34_02150 [Patescibacteria group bacterium]|nr:hypothetical protein [Patescibacteria group bacterium]MDD5715265.1 hypothetical protein [Patescibacteria group bacterium]
MDQVQNTNPVNQPTEQGSPANGKGGSKAMVWVIVIAVIVIAAVVVWLLVG